jgi:RNA polymerase sigma-70 factor (ECF subfamily)
VTTGHRPDQDRHEHEATLGDLLYARRTKPPAPEKCWGDLLRAIAGGDQHALHALYSQTHRIVFTLSMRITGNRETAEEVTLDVFHDVWRRASAYDPAGGSVIGWILNQARSRAIDRLRFEQRKKRLHGQGDSPLPVQDPRGPQETFEAKEQGQLLRDALRELTPAERQTLETAFFAELTYPEVAEHLSQPLGTVKTRIRSGLAKLRAALARESKGL